jgi:excisionase family DNA binding protein
VSEHAREINSPSEDLLMTSEEVARLLKVPPSWVEEKGRQGEIPRRKIGRYVRFSRLEVEAWIQCQGK